MGVYGSIDGKTRNGWRNGVAVTVCWLAGCAATGTTRVADSADEWANGPRQQATEYEVGTSEETAGTTPPDAVTAADALRDAAMETDGPPPEIQEEHWDNGVVKRSSEGKLGPDGEFIRHGITTTFYESGQLKSKTYWADNKPHGPRTTWYLQGQIWSNGAYVNGREDGTWTRWHQTGEKHAEWHMRNGVWNGTYTEWHSNGLKRLEVEFVNGLRQGPQLLWDEQGVLMSKSDYVDGVEQP